MDQPRKVLLISGSLRRASTNTALLETARVVAPRSLTLCSYSGIADLPHFNPDDDRPPRDLAVELLRDAIRSADAVLFSTPEYAGGLPGSFKNALDWEVGDDQIGSLNEKPVAWINGAPRGAADAHASLRRCLVTSVRGSSKKLASTFRWEMTRLVRTDWSIPLTFGAR